MAPIGLSPLIAALPSDPFPPQAAAHIGLSPPCALPLPPWPILTLGRGGRGLSLRDTLCGLAVARVFFFCKSADSATGDEGILLPLRAPPPPPTSAHLRSVSDKAKPQVERDKPKPSRGPERAPKRPRSEVGNGRTKRVRPPVAKRAAQRRKEDKAEVEDPLKDWEVENRSSSEDSSSSSSSSSSGSSSGSSSDDDEGVCAFLSFFLKTLSSPTAVGWRTIA